MKLKMDARTLRPGQLAQLYIVDATTGEQQLVTESSTLLFEAPNWTPDGDWLLVNGDGLLYRISPADGVPHLIDVPGIPLINNDHVLSPDGSTIYVSGFDGHLYAVDLATRDSRRVSNDRGDDFYYFLHGVSPDNKVLAYIGLQGGGDGAFTANVYAIPTTGGDDVQLTDDAFPDDGSEFSPDGEWIYFNSERGSTVAGHAQLFRMRPDGSQAEQLTDDERVNWFPHLSPDGERIAYISFPPGTLGHPADLDVTLRVIDKDGGTRDLVTLFGGQGTINVNSWAPDNRRFAYVAYPIQEAGQF